jgi:hypothetical protein
VETVQLDPLLFLTILLYMVPVPLQLLQDLLTMAVAVGLEMHMLGK